MSKEELQKELETLLEAGDTKGAEEFIVAHFTELPEDAQGAALMYFASQTLEARAAEKNIEHLRKVGLSALAEIQATKEALKDGDR